MADLERRIKAGETLTREEVLEVWNDVRVGIRKQFPHNARTSMGFFKIPEHREILAQEFNWQFLREHGRYPEKRDYRRAKLDGLLGHYYNSSSYQLLTEVGFTNPKNVVYYDVVLDKMPWLAIRLPQGFWQDKESRAKAIRWVVCVCRKLGKSLEDITWGDIQNLIGPVRAAQKNSITLPQLFEAAGYKIHPAEVQKVPDGYWHSRANRTEYFLRRTKQLGRPPGSREVLSSLLKAAGSYKTLLAEAGLLTHEKSD